MPEKVVNTIVANHPAHNASETSALRVPSQRAHPTSLNAPCIPVPSGSGRMGRVDFRSVLFYGPRLADALAETVQYLETLEEVSGTPPHTVFMHEEFSWEDAGSDLAWQVTLIFGEPAQPKCA